MSDLLQQRLSALRETAPQAAHGALTGLEKESLRVDDDGYLATTPHPPALGSALTNRFITTDFSEALLEFVTPAYGDLQQTLDCLRDLQQFSLARMGGEHLWNASMPCLLGDDASIPLARYGSSNVARMKTVYRRGLSYRYGRAMQTIAGVHFNFSLPDAFWREYRAHRGSDASLQVFRSASYLELARNFRRFGWIVLYLFGASPAMCKSFLGDRSSTLAEFDAGTLFEPFATSLRMSDLGYSSNAQSRLSISLNSLQEYIDGLTAAIMTPHAPYAAFGVQRGGQWRQLNTSILQIENEYYSSIRPKQVAHSGERPTLALQRAGVQYVEVRSLDINPFDPVGVSSEQMYFMQALLVYCLLTDSPPLDAAECADNADNHVVVAHSGRAPGLELRRAGRLRPLSDWARDIHAGVSEVADWLDNGDGRHVAAVAAQLPAIDDPDACPSARVLRAMRDSGLEYSSFMLERARAHHAWFDALPPLGADLEAELEREVSASIERQHEIEARQQAPFEDYLAAYYAAATAG